MARRLFKRYMPSPDQFHEKTMALKFLGERLHRPSLWHLNRHSVSKAFAIGLFCTWLPMPFQTVVAAVLAIVFCANLPLSVILVFITNPITIPPLFYFAYTVGAKILGVPAEQIDFQLSLEWIKHIIEDSWQPLLLGSLVMAVLSSIVGYVVTKLLWRLRIVLLWRNRKETLPNTSKYDDNPK